MRLLFVRSSLLRILASTQQQQQAPNFFHDLLQRNPHIDLLTQADRGLYVDTFVTMSGTNHSQHTSNEKYAESIMNLTLLDPPKWGWTAAGGVADLLPPHEVRISCIIQRRVEFYVPFLDNQVVSICLKFFVSTANISFTAG